MPLHLSHHHLADDQRVHVLTTTRADGDLRVDLAPEVLDDRRSGVVARPWVWLHQVHGADVVRVESIDAAGSTADAAVTDLAGLVLAVHTADCASVALVGSRGAVGVAHAGWRGLAAGVLQRTVEALRSSGEDAIVAEVGPVICPLDYEFGAQELERIADRYGGQVRATTRTGCPALDLAAGVRAALDESGVRVVAESGLCPAEHPEVLYSHRARRDVGRQAMVVWKDPSP